MGGRSGTRGLGPNQESGELGLRSHRAMRSRVSGSRRRRSATGLSFCPRPWGIIATAFQSHSTSSVRLKGSSTGYRHEYDNLFLWMKRQEHCRQPRVQLPVWRGREGCAGTRPARLGQDDARRLRASLARQRRIDPVRRGCCAGGPGRFCGLCADSEGGHLMCYQVSTPPLITRRSRARTRAGAGGAGSGPVPSRACR